MAEIKKIKIGDVEYDIRAAYADKALEQYIGYGTCSTAAESAEKIVTISDTSWTLKIGSIVTVKFAETNTAASPTLNVNSTGAKPIYYNNAVYTSSSSYGGYKDRHIIYQYDGTNWVFISWGYDTNSDTEVTQSAAITTAGEYPVILGYSTSTSSVTNTVKKASTLTYNPSTKILTAPTFKGDLKGTANSAISDGNDKNIVNTYETKTDAATKLSTAKTYADNKLVEAKSYSDTNLSTAKTYTDTKVADVVNSAPETLDTLNELAAALGNDANFSTTITNLIGTKLPLAGGTMTAGAGIKWGAKNNLTPYIGHCTSSSDGTFVVGSLKGTVWNTGLAIGGGSGNLLWKGAQVATVDTTALTNYLPLAGGNMSGHIYLTGSQASNSTGNTTQIIFGQSNNQHVAISSNDNALVINPSSTETSNADDGASQIVLYLNKASSFPKGISGNLSGNASTATQFASDTTVSATGDATGTSAASKKGWSIPLTLANSGVTAGNYGPSANASPAHGKTFSVPYITVDAKGRVTAASTKTITLPTYGVATSSALGLVKSGTDITVDSSGNVSVVDGSHNHSAGNITSGTLAVARGGTGVTSNPSMLINLASTSAASVFAASPRPGVTGTLPIANGGTGATTASAARANLEAAKVSIVRW